MNEGGFPVEQRGLVNRVVREVMELTHGEAVKNGVSLLTELADSTPLIPGDRIQLQQVMLNLIINAVEAMSGVGNGARELLITTGKPPRATCWLRFAIPVLGWRWPPSSASSTPSTRASRAVWGWDCRSAARSSKRTADDCGRAQT